MGDLLLLQPALKWALLGLALVGVAGGAVLVLQGKPPPCEPPPLTEGEPRLFAWRGAPDHPPAATWVGFTMSGVFEATLPAYERAVARGMTGLDVPVRLSADGILVVLEEEDVTRTTNGEGRVAELTWEVLSGLDAGGGARIPRLDQVLGRFGAGVTYHFRIDGGEEGRAVARGLGRVLSGPDEGLDAFVASTDPAVLVEARRQLPSLRAALIVPAERDWRADVGRHTEACLSAVELPAERIDADAVAWARDHQLALIASGVEQAAAWTALKALGIRWGLSSFTTFEGGEEPLPPQGEVELEELVPADPTP